VSQVRRGVNREISSINHHQTSWSFFFAEHLISVPVSSSVTKPLENNMNKIKLATLVAIAVASSSVVYAQGGAATGAATGAVGGAVIGGPVGAVVGAGVGAVAGGIADDTRPRFRTYVSGQKHSSYKYQNEVRVGADLPSSGVTYYEVPKEYGVTKYRYTVVNDRTVLVDPESHRIVQVIE
jgi:hypothetical protein